ncbi:hypothetical protein ALC56_09302 [Trachymyrmex septentrionalis]|uniref:Uncharacterized protein n=1 Tax=Trachymyrmex septentrionalis TaxID=34720 RepID=A0A195F827_9HYME|nr:hypothetical protein ALC56_09302 [Trachymyrmex septentrionalis]
MGVRRIPLRLPRAAPVPPCPESSSSISPCLFPPSRSSNPSEGRGQSYASTQSGPEKKSESALNPSPGATYQHRLNHPTAGQQKIFLNGSKEDSRLSRVIREHFLIHVRVPFTRLMVFMLTIA